MAGDMRPDFVFLPAERIDDIWVAVGAGAACRSPNRPAERARIVVRRKSFMVGVRGLSRRRGWPGLVTQSYDPERDSAWNAIKRAPSEPPTGGVLRPVYENGTDLIEMGHPQKPLLLQAKVFLSLRKWRSSRFQLKRAAAMETTVVIPTNSSWAGTREPNIKPSGGKKCRTNASAGPCQR